MENREELEMSQWRAYVDVSVLQFKESVREENDIVVKERCSSQIGVLAVQGCFAEESCETFTLFRNEVAE